MKKIAAATLAVLVAAGCSSSEPERTDEMVFLMAMRTIMDNVGMGGVPDDLIIEISDLYCEIAEDSSSGEEFFMTVKMASDRAGNDPGDQAYVAGAALAGWCPEQVERLDIGG